MPNSPTIVSAALSDKELQDSINKMVANFDKGLQDMLDHSNKYVEKIQQSLQKIGDTNFGATGSNDGGISKQTKAQNEFTDAVKKSTNEIKRQGKEGEMSFDQIAAALSKARQTVSEFNTKRTSGILPSSKDYKRYEQALARIVEYNDKLKQSALSRADANQWANVFDAKRVISDISAVDDRYKKLVRWYTVLEKEDQRRIASEEKANQKRLADLEKEKAAREKMIESARKAEQKYQDATLKSAFRGALTLPTNSVDELRYKIERITALAATLKKEGLIDDAQFNRANVAVAKLNEQLNKQLATEKEVKAVQSQQVQPQVKSARDSYIAFMQGYKEQANQLTQLIQNEENRLVQAQQSRVTALGQQIDQNKTKIQELREQMQQLAQEEKNAPSRYGVKDAYRTAIQQTNDEINKLIAKNKELESEQQKVASTDPLKQQNATLDELRAKRDKVLNMMREETSSTQQQAQAQQQLTQSAKEYSEQVKKIAAEIRESAQWQKSDKFGFRRGMVSLEGRSYPVSENLSMGLRLEDQIVSILQRANDERQKGVQITQQQAQSSRQVSEEDRKAMEALGWVDSQQKRKYTPPMMNIERISEARGALQSITGMQEAWVDSINKTKSSYYQLSDYVKQLKNELVHLPKGVHDEAAKVLIREIQQAEREMQKFQKTMSRPVSLKDALSGSEKTLDDIAYKMQRLRAYKQGIDLTKPNATNEIKQVDEALAKLQKDADKWMSKSNEMIKSNTALGRSWNYMKNRLAFYFTVGASTQFIKNLVEVRSQYEMNERALGILIDSAERGTRIFNELSQMALVSPYTLIELSTAAKQLTAYDVAAKDVVDTTRRLADMAAAVGIPIERLTYALGQIKAYGYLNARDARMFSNAGIPLVKQLAEHYTELEGKMVSTADVYDRIKKKAIDMTDVMQVINKMTDEGGKFFDFQAKMAGTLKVQLANLTLAWNNMLNDIGASEQGAISTGIGLLKELFLEWKNISKMITNLAIGFGIVKVAQLAYYGVVMGTNKAIALETVLGNRLSNNLRSLTSSMNAARMSSTALWVGIATVAAAAVVDILRGNEAIKEFNKTLRENAENTYNDLKKFSENYSGLRESLYKTENGKQTPVDINSEEAKKAWEVLREQIELSSHASDEYISKLLSIENVSERLRQGFAMIESIQSVSAAIKELGDSSIKLERDWSEWWNLGLLPDGTIGNLQDAYMWLSKIEEKYGSVVNARKVASTSRTDEGLDNVFQDEAKEFVENYETELEKFRKDLQVTKQSIIDFIELKGWSGDTSKINEAFKIFTDNLILKNQLNPQQAYTLQLEMEEARSKAAKQAQYARIKDLERAYYIEKNKQHKEELAEEYKKEAEIYNNWDNFNGRKKIEWERFTKWLKEQHISETTAMFRNMDAEDIRSLNFQEGKHAEWVKRMVTQYAKEHKMSYDDAFGYLKSWVTSANQWSIFIPMTISTEDTKTVYKQLGEYDKAVDEADAQIARLTTRINELNAKKKKSKEETKELADAEKELTQAQKDKADAEAKGGHGKKEKKDEKAANKAAKQAESELQKALKEELSTIEKVRSIYKDLTKEGMSHADAVERATRGWGETVNAINKVLTKNGLQKLDLSKFAGIENPRELVNMLQSQLNTLLKRGAKPAEIKELQTKVNTLEVDADKYDLTKITKGLNNELGKLKDEYELAVELDANPELGDMFADYFGINLKELPKDYEQALRIAQKRINTMLKENPDVGIASVDIEKLMSRDEFDSWVQSLGKDASSELIKSLTNVRSWLYKVRSDETKKQIQEWDKMLEKYAEYEHKKKQITEDYEKETATALKMGANASVLKAIENRRDTRYAELDFSEFMKTPEWITATGNLAGMSKTAIDMLIDRINKYKNTAKYLSPKQIKELNKALKQLHAEQKKNNPFKAISNMLAEAKERMQNFDKEIEDVNKEIGETESAIKAAATAGADTSKQEEALKKLKERLSDLQKAREKAGKLDASEWVSSINETVTAVQAAVGVFNDLAKAIGGVNSNEVDKVFGVLEKAGSSAAIGAVIGGGIGVVAGAAVGAATSIISWITDDSNERITEKIEESERTVKRLENAYKDLEDAINHAYGTAAISAKKTAIFNKELQLAELKRQLALEQSRDSKDRDGNRIVELEGQIKDLELEIKNTTEEIVNDLLGISSVGDAMETMMDSFIDALRNGEDAMSVFDESVNNMIANMIKKLFVTRILEPWFENVWSSIENKAKERTKGFYEDLEKYYSIDYWKSVAANGTSSQEKAWNGMGEQMKEYFRETWGDIVDQMDWLGTQQDFANSLVAAYKSGGITVDDIREFAELIKTNSPIIQDGFEEVNAILEELGLINSNKTLSALQQGLQSMSEDTGSALESYMNGVSQQVYLHSDLLTQIRDAVVGIDIDVQVATQAQMLLQLQQSYAVQMAIQGILEGVLVPSGRAFSVELVS